MAPPSKQHQEIVGAIYAAIREHVKGKKGKYMPYIAPFAVFLTNDESTYVEPDLLVVCDPEKLNDKGCWGAPDMVIEVVSPSSKKIDYYTKLILYRDAGVKEYWIVDPSRKMILMYSLEESEAPVIYRFSDTVPVGIMNDLCITLNTLLDES